MFALVVETAAAAVFMTFDGASHCQRILGLVNIYFCHSTNHVKAWMEARPGKIQKFHLGIDR